MSADNPFRPPEAVVDDIAVDDAAARSPVIALGLAGLLQVGWFASVCEGFFRLTDVAALTPIGLLLALAGEACLAVAIVRMAWRQRRPWKTFAAAVVLLAGAAVAWRALSFGVLVLFLAGVLLAAIGWRLARPRAVARVA